MTNESNKKRKEELMELQFFDQQIKQMEQQLMQIEQQILELNEVIENLKEIEVIKPGTEILVSVANGIFAKAEIKDVKNLKVNIGAGIVSQKSSIQTREMLQTHLKNVESAKEELFITMQQMINHATSIQKQISTKD